MKIFDFHDIYDGGFLTQKGFIMKLTAIIRRLEKEKIKDYAGKIMDNLPAFVQEHGVFDTEEEFIVRARNAEKDHLNALVFELFPYLQFSENNIESITSEVVVRPNRVTIIGKESKSQIYSYPVEIEDGAYNELKKIVERGNAVVVYHLMKDGATNRTIPLIFDEENGTCIEFLGEKGSKDIVSELEVQNETQESNQSIIKYDRDGILEREEIIDILGVTKAAFFTMFSRCPYLRVGGKNKTNHELFLKYVLTRTKRFKPPRKTQIVKRFGFESIEDACSEIGLPLTKVYGPRQKDYNEVLEKLDKDGLYTFLEARNLIGGPPSIIGLSVRFGKLFVTETDEGNRIKGSELWRFYNRPLGKEYTFDEALKAVPGLTASELKEEIDSHKKIRNITGLQKVVET